MDFQPQLQTGSIGNSKLSAGVYVCLSLWPCDELATGSGCHPGGHPDLRHPELREKQVLKMDNGLSVLPGVPTVHCTRQHISVCVEVNPIFCCNICNSALN